MKVSNKMFIEALWKKITWNSFVPVTRKLLEIHMYKLLPSNNSLYMFNAH